MILNLDLGNLYLKAVVIEERSKTVVSSEIIRLERKTPSVIEVLITSIIDNYSQVYEIKKINIIPNIEFIECEIIEYESIVESKYEKVMKEEINRVKREEKRKERMGNDYTPSTKKLKHSAINFSKELKEKTVFHMIENKGLMTTQIYVEYVNTEYLKILDSLIRSLGKEVSIISPIRAIKYLPFPKKNRIIVNYGHKFILTVIIEVKDGKEVIKEVIREAISDASLPNISELEGKHSNNTVTDPIYQTKLSDIRNLKNKYPGYEVYSIGGNANYIQNDLLTSNELVNNFRLPNIPKVLENVVFPSFVTDYKDFPYNSLQIQMKNRVLNVVTLTSKASKTIIDLSGDLLVAGLIIALISSYGITTNYMNYNGQLKALKSQVENYEKSGGKLEELSKKLYGLQTGRTKNYYNIAELLTSISSPMEIESLEVNGKSIKMVAYADNVALVRDFLETVKARQLTNSYTKFSLKETDMQTIYKDGRRLDRITFEGKIY